MTDPRICPPDHKHGQTTTCYQEHKCRCDECRTLRAAKERDRVHRAKKGKLQVYVNAITTVPRIMQLQREGWTYTDIEAVSGVSVPTIQRIMCGVTKRVTQETADAILGTQPHMRRKAPAPRMVDATGTIRRIRALVAVGWTFRAISARAGHSKGWAVTITYSTTVQHTTADLIARLYDEMWCMKPPMGTAQERESAGRARKLAERKGWGSPLAWDDDTIDDPDAEPAVPSPEDLWATAVESAIAGERPELTSEQRLEVVTVLNERRWSASQIAEHIGCSTKTIDRIRKKLSLPIYLYNETTYRDVA